MVSTVKTSDFLAEEQTFWLAVTEGRGHKTAQNMFCKFFIWASSSRLQLLKACQPWDESQARDKCEDSFTSTADLSRNHYSSTNPQDLADDDIEDNISYQVKGKKMKSRAISSESFKMMVKAPWWWNQPILKAREKYHPSMRPAWLFHSRKNSRNSRKIVKVMTQKDKIGKKII